MSWNAEEALRQGLANQTERVAKLRETMETYRKFYEQFKGDYESANEILERMQALDKQWKKLK
jgi:hypothetical protein